VSSTFCLNEEDDTITPVSAVFAKFAIPLAAQAERIEGAKMASPPKGKMMPKKASKEVKRPRLASSVRRVSLTDPSVAKGASFDMLKFAVFPMQQKLGWTRKKTEADQGVASSSEDKENVGPTTAR
jgi:hypothetical protein